MKETIKSLALATLVWAGPFLVLGTLYEMGFRATRTKVSKNVYLNQWGDYEFYDNHIGLDTNKDGKLDMQIRRYLPFRVTPALTVIVRPKDRDWDLDLQKRYESEYKKIKLE